MLQRWDSMEVVEASLRHSTERNSEWQRLMRRWETACANYATTCNERATVQDPALANMIEQRRLKLIEVKREIDTLISLCSRARRARHRPLYSLGSRQRPIIRSIEISAEARLPANARR
jgi:hypothetical protein